MSPCFNQGDILLSDMLTPLKTRWKAEGGYREVLHLAIPLILSTGSMTIQHFVDRMFLTWFSSNAIAAAMPAGIVNFTFMSIFIGTAAYVNTFVAQYHGAKKYDHIGPTVWQGIYFSLLSGLGIFILYPLAPAIFKLAGHAPEVQILEVQYFQILIYSAFPTAASSALAGFFSGRGKTKVIMWVSFIATGINIILDYLLIFGKFGFPALGMQGAAIATVISQIARLLLYIILMLNARFDDKFHTRRGWRFNKTLFFRLIRFGFPNGLHFFLDMTGFTLFILIVGKFGTAALAATNITFNINHLAFMPMMGCGMALSVLVGNKLGQDRPEIAEKATWSTLQMAFVYTALIGAAYAFLPNIFLLPYASKAQPQEFLPIAKTTTILLKFVAVYCLFDMMNIIFASAVKGAGDTRYVMNVSVLLSWILMVIPSYFLSQVYQKTIYHLWACATAYICVLGIVFLFRFLGGKWKNMRVIEKSPKIPSEPL